MANLWCKIFFEYWFFAIFGFFTHDFSFPSLSAKFTKISRFFFLLVFMVFTIFDFFVRYLMIQSDLIYVTLWVYDLRSIIGNFLNKQNVVPSSLPWLLHTSSKCPSVPGVSKAMIAILCVNLSCLGLNRNCQLLVISRCERSLHLCLFVCSYVCLYMCVVLQRLVSLSRDFMCAMSCWLRFEWFSSQNLST